MRRNKESLKRVLVGWCTKVTIFFVVIYIVIQFFIGGSAMTPARQTVHERVVEKAQSRGKRAERHRMHNQNHKQELEGKQVVLTSEKLVSTVRANEEIPPANHLLLDANSHSLGQSNVPCPFTDSMALLEALKRKGIPVTSFPDSTVAEYTLEFNPEDTRSMKYLHLCIDTGMGVDSSTSITFHKIALQLSSSSAVPGDCDMYLSASNAFPKHSILTPDIQVNSEPASNAASWDWKSNYIGNDEITLFTYMPEFVVEKPAVSNSWFEGHTPKAYKDLFIGIGIRQDEPGQVTDSRTNVACNLKITLENLDKAALSKKLNLRGNGQVILPRDIQ